MKVRRLIRALEAGGAAYESAGGTWDVRRSQDARGAIIGCLTQADFAALKAQGRLKRLGDIAPVRYVWCGAKLSQDAPEKASLDAFLQREPEPPTSLLGIALSELSDQAEAQTLDRAAAWYAEDFAAAHRHVSVSGMNWQALALGGRIDRSFGAETKDDPLFRVAAQRRLGVVAQHFTSDALREIDCIILNDLTPKAFAAKFGLKPNKASLRAVDLLRRLSWIYEKEVKTPVRAAEA